MAVNVLRKSSTNSEVQVISKGLIKSWKKLLTGNVKEGEGKIKIWAGCSYLGFNPPSYFEYRVAQKSLAR